MPCSVKRTSGGLPSDSAQKSCGPGAVVVPFAGGGDEFRAQGAFLEIDRAGWVHFLSNT